MHTNIFETLRPLQIDDVEDSLTDGDNKQSDVSAQRRLGSDSSAFSLFEYSNCGSLKSTHALPEKDYKHVNESLLYQCSDRLYDPHRHGARTSSQVRQPSCRYEGNSVLPTCNMDTPSLYTGHIDEPPQASHQNLHDRSDVASVEWQSGVVPVNERCHVTAAGERSDRLCDREQLGMSRVETVLYDARSDQGRDETACYHYSDDTGAKIIERPVDLDCKQSIQIESQDCCDPQTASPKSSNDDGRSESPEFITVVHRRRRRGRTHDHKYDGQGDRASFMPATTSHRNSKRQQKPSRSRSGKKLEYCWFFNTKKSCRKGANCRYMHPDSVCVFYPNKSGCRNGITCTFSHHELDKDKLPILPTEGTSSRKTRTRSGKASPERQSQGNY